MKFRHLFFWLFLVVSLFLVFFGLWWQWGNQPACEIKKETGPCPEKLFVIKRGDGMKEIAARLEENQIIKNALVFKIQVVKNRLAGRIQAGEYYLSGREKTLRVAQRLTKGAFDKKVTIPEGWRSEEIGQFLFSQGIDFNLANWQEEVRKQGLEGFLFPDTYLIPKSISTEELIGIFLANFEKKFTRDLEKEALSKGIDKESVLVLASLIEREVKHDQDRAVVAGILLKRLANDWPLQVDASIQYALASRDCLVALANCPWWPSRLSEADLKIQSPYNTYLSRGLPPGPICNPGLSSIKAVVYPQVSSYWFYLSDQNGVIHYALDAEEHAENIRRYLR